jgi:dipeptidyl aminopeptidase/acylaminoacyl peptidase
LITAEDESLPGDYPVGWQPFPLFAKNGEELTWSELNAVKAFVLRDGVERVLFEGNSGRRGLARSDDGWLLMAPHNRSPLFVAREGDEDVRVVTALDETEISHRHPQFLPDGEHFLFWAVTPDPSKSAACVGSLSEGKLRCLVDTMSPAIYAESHLFFVRDGALFAQPFDRRSLTLKGEATLVVGSVGAPIGFPANFAVSENGVLAYGPDETSEPTRLVWYDREGNELGELGPRGDYDQIVLSPDGERVAAQMVDQTTNSMDVWTIDRRGVPTRLTSWPLFDGHPVWSPSGDRLLFSSDRGGGTNELYVDVLDDDEPPRLLLDSEGSPEASDWDRQDRIWFSLVVTPRGRDIWVLRDGAAEPFLATEHNELTPQVSPDGAWLAFVSDVSGRLEVYAQPLRRSGERKRLSHDGGQQPRWRGDGRELFYLDLDGTVMAVDFEAAYAGRARARALFRPSIELPAIWSTYAPTPDGERFLIVEKPPERPPFAYTVLLNWRNAAERR